MTPSATNLFKCRQEDIGEKYSRMLVTVCVPEVKFVQIYSNFCQLHSRSEFLKDTCEGKEAWKIVEGNIFADIFHEFEPPVILIKWFTYNYK